MAQVSAPDYDPSWSVPEGTYRPLFDRRQRYCVVIPVINEGERIRDQLRRMRELGIPQVCDVIIVDGGSTDDSLADDVLEEAGVRALLIKTGPGKLSAQLRMAYAYALAEGYDGVITIDGNGKDSVESIPAFAEALDSGYDYVQGSRFVEGGRAVNTPRERYWAIRLMHAPVISLAAHKYLTDTTNGFRAYSRRYLLHPEVQPFRDVFSTYELLAYLSARASRLGLRVTEIPVTRSYPADGPTPTKISSTRGHLDLLGILGKLLIGHYNP